MIWLNILIVIIVFSAKTETCNTKLITILSDFSNEDDVIFFKTTLPWIVENIGSNIRINYRFKNGRNNTGIKECVLDQMNGNTYLQASYLSYEAQGVPTKEAVSIFPIDVKKFAVCLTRKSNLFAKLAAKEFSRIKSDKTPIVVLPRNKKISQVQPEIYLKDICVLFGRNQPHGCVSPIPFTKQNDSKRLTPKTDKSTQAITINPNFNEDTTATFSDHTTVTSNEMKITSNVTPITSNQTIVTSDELTVTKNADSSTTEKDSNTTTDPNTPTIPNTSTLPLPKTKEDSVASTTENEINSDTKADEYSIQSKE